MSDRLRDAYKRALGGEDGRLILADLCEQVELGRATFPSSAEQALALVHAQNVVLYVLAQMQEGEALQTATTIMELTRERRDDDDDDGDAGADAIGFHFVGEPGGDGNDDGPESRC